MNRIYLDNNAAVPLDEEVAQYYISQLSYSWANPSSVHKEGQSAKHVLLEAKNTIRASLCIPSSHEIYFFSSATEALNTIITGAVSYEKQSAASAFAPTFISSYTEHAAVYEVLSHLYQKGEIELHYMPTTSYGAPSLQAVTSLIEAIQTRCRSTQLKSTYACFMAVNNETGVITDQLPQIAQFVSQLGVHLIVDGVAMLGKMPFTFLPNVSAYVFSGHKIHAPRGVSFAIIKKGYRFCPLIMGGPQEGRKRAGTENVAAIAACAYAVKKLTCNIQSVQDHLSLLQIRFETQLKQLLPGKIEINGDGYRAFSTSNIAFSNIDGEDMLISLDLRGIAASHGSACASGALEPSRILTKMGYSTQRVSSSLRFSFSQKTTIAEIDEAVACIVDIAHMLYAKKT